MEKYNTNICISGDALKIGEAAMIGMLYEVGTSPKPGMVTPFSKGVHRDMDHFTFLRSSASLVAAMVRCAQIGLENSKDILKGIRAIGITAEEQMLLATKGVNTQKGILFIGGIVSASAGLCVNKKIEMSRENISRECKVLTEGIVERELKSLNTKKTMTNGERIYKAHGICGIRGEVEKGLPSVLEVGLPLYEEALAKGLTLNQALVYALIGLMTRVEDTVVIHRSGLGGLEYMKSEAKVAMELGGMYTAVGTNYIEGLNEKFIKNNISPGGAADLLAITVMVHELEKLKI